MCVAHAQGTAVEGVRVPEERVHDLTTRLWRGCVASLNAASEELDALAEQRERSTGCTSPPSLPHKVFRQLCRTCLPLPAGAAEEDDEVDAEAAAEQAARRAAVGVARVTALARAARVLQAPRSLPVAERIWLAARMVSQVQGWGTAPRAGPADQHPAGPR